MKSREDRDRAKAKAQQEREEWIRKFREEKKDKDKGLPATVSEHLPEINRALIALERKKKVLVEFACSEDSSLGKVGNRTK